MCKRRNQALECSAVVLNLCEHLQESAEASFVAAASGNILSRDDCRHANLKSTCIDLAWPRF